MYMLLVKTSTHDEQREEIKILRGLTHAYYLLINTIDCGRWIHFVDILSAKKSAPRLVTFYVEICHTTKSLLF